MRRRAVARAGEAELARLAPRRLEEILERGVRRLRRDDEAERHVVDQHDRHEIRQRIEAHVLHKMRVDPHLAGVAVEQRVAVGRALRHDLRGDVAARTGAVVDQHRLPERRGELVGHHAAEVVGGAARQVRRADEERVSPLRADRLMQLRLNGETLNYVKEGRGPAIVFIHFIGGFSGSWRHQFAALKERYTCIAFDTRGFGFSTYNGPWDAATAPSDVKAGMDALEGDHAPIVAFSTA